MKVDTIAPVIEMMDELKLGEYLYYDLGSFTYINPITQNQPGGAGFVASDVSQIRVRNNGHIVRAGVNYRFNWGGAGPVVARY